MSVCRLTLGVIIRCLCHVDKEKCELHFIGEYNLKQWVITYPKRTDEAEYIALRLTLSLSVAGIGFRERKEK